ncbi:DMT family transporter [Georgenia yuyongxinii]|uniref:EamA family transporter n=1 Tax=Georgenia yuyongxinii TaxID=2589797 RepID=A0A552WPH7_9MICO|nr:DMT family transporter [Georgenia yuyongxinii]TRW44617.1 EamA family transporter [Georgenia yuyongxinii]
MAQGGPHTAAKFAAVALMWGSSFLFIRVAVEGISPAQLALGRLVVGAAVLTTIMLLTRRRWPRERRTLGHLTVLALVLCVVPFLLFAWAGQHIPSGLSSIYNATTPIMTLLISLVALPQERLTAVRAAALALAAAGVVVIAAPWTLVTEPGGDHFLLGQLAALGATTCYGAGYVYMRRYLAGSGYDAVTVSATQIGIAALIMVLLAPFVATDPVALDGAIVASVVALGALSTGVAYIWNFDVVRAWGATLASTVTYLTPVVGVVLGVVVLGETFTLNQPLGALLVIVGIVVGQGHLRLPRGRALEPGVERSRAARVEES